MTKQFLMTTTGAGFALLALSGLSAQAQTFGSNALSLVYQNDVLNNVTKTSAGTASQDGLRTPVGQDSNDSATNLTGTSPFPTAGTSTLNSVYDTYDLGPGGTQTSAFTGLTAGQQLEFGLHAYGLDTASPGSDVTVNVGLFAYNGPATATGASILSALAGPDLFGTGGLGISFTTPVGTTTDGTYFSGATTLTSNIAPGDYVLAFTGSSDYALVDQIQSTAEMNDSVAATEQAFDSQVFDRQDSGTPTLVGQTKPISFEIYASPAMTPPPPVVPESGSLALLGLGIAPLALVAARRRRAA